MIINPDNLSFAVIISPNSVKINGHTVPRPRHDNILEWEAFWQQLSGDRIAQLEEEVARLEDEIEDAKWEKV